MNFNLKKALLAGTAIVAVGGFAFGATAAEVDSTGTDDWGAIAADFAGADADSLHFATATDTVTVDAAEAIGTTTQNSRSMSIDTRSHAGTVVFDAGAAGPGAAMAVFGDIGDSSDFTATGNVATLTLGTGTGDDGANVTLRGDVAAGTVINITTGTGNGTLTLGNGTTTTTVGANIDLDAGDDDGNTVLNLNNTTVTGNILDTDTDNGANGMRINVLTSSSVSGTIVLDTADAEVVVNDGDTLTLSGAIVDTSGTIVLGNATTAGANLVFSGTGVQAVTAVIDSDVVNQGSINVTRTGGVVTFNGNIGTTTDLATFTMAADTSVNTVNELRANTVTIGSGATLNADDVIVGNVANSGTLDLSAGAAAVTGNITGTGTLAASANAAIVGNVTQNAATIAASSELEIDAGTGTGTVNIGTVTAAAADSVLQLISDAGETTTFTGNVTGANGFGSVTFGDNAAEAQNYVFNGNIGTSATVRANDILVGGANGAAVVTTINGNVWADDVTVGAADTLNLYGTTVNVDDLLGAGNLVIGNGTSATAVTTVQNAAGDFANFTVANNSSLTTAGSIRADVFAVNGSFRTTNTATITSDASFTVGGDGAGALIIDGATTLATQGITFGDTAGDTAELRIGSNANLDPTAAPAIAAGGRTITFTTGTVTTLGLSNSQTVGVETGDVLTFINGAGNANFDTEVTDGRIVFDNGLLSFDYEESVANTIRAAVTYADANTVFGGSAGAGAANFLVNLTDAAAGTANLDTLRDGLLSAGTAAQQQAFAESIAPQVDGGFVVGASQAAGQSINTTNTRMAALRGGEATGMVAGEMGEGLGVWGKAFGQMAEQDMREGVAGYEADTYGFALGVDTESLMDDAVFGVSFSYGQTEVDSDGVNNTETDVDSYQLSLYGNKDLADDMYVSGILGYAWNDIDQTRYNVAGTANNNASADFDSDQFMLYAEFGKDFMMDNNMTLTPRVLANYQHISIDGYTETGSTANLSVDTDDMDIFEMGVGVTAAWDLQDNMGNSIVPSLSAEYRYDFVEDSVQSTSSFTGGGTSFRTEGFDPAQSTFELGAGLEYSMDENWTVSADYGYTFKEDYDAHSASLRAGYKF